MNYTSTRSFESKLIPGLTYVLRLPSFGRRSSLEDALAPALAKAADINRELEPVTKEIERAEEAAKLEPCTCSNHEHKKNEIPRPDGTVIEIPGCASCDCQKPQPDNDAYIKRLELTNKLIMILDREIHPARIKWAVTKVEGLDIDEEPVTLDSLLEKLPDNVVNELALEVDKVTRLSNEEVMAFALPTTGSAAVDGPTKSTNAGHAS